MVAIILCVFIFFPFYSPLYWLSGSREEDWSFSIEGLVDAPYTVTYREMLRMPSTTVEAKLYCFPNKLVPVQEGNWTGVQLSLLLQKAGLKQDVIELAFYASDDFTADISVEDALRPDVIIAYKLNGRLIGGKEGYPKNRLVIPGAWGFKWVAWIVKIEAVDYDFEASYGEMEEPVDIPLGSTVPNTSTIRAFSSGVFCSVSLRVASPSTLISHEIVRKRGLL